MSHFSQKKRSESKSEHENRDQRNCEKWHNKTNLHVVEVFIQKKTKSD